MTILQRYIDEVVKLYTFIHPSSDVAKVKALTCDFIDKSFRDIPCTMKNNVTHESIDTTVCEVTDWIDTKQPIITGNGTFFKQHDEYLAPVIIFLEALLKKRKSVKKEMFTKKKGSIEYINLNTEQGNIKVVMNSDYGGSGTQFSPFYSVYIPPATTGTAKNTTTTLICCLEFAFSNKDKWVKLKDVNELFDMIKIVLEDNRERQLIDDVYSVDEVLKYLINRVLTVTPNDIKLVRIFLSNLDNKSLTKLMLAFNIRLVVNKYLYGDFSVLSNYMKNHQLDLDSEITTESLHVAGFGTKCPEELAPIFDHAKKVIVDNCCYPFILNDAETRANEMTRDIVCVTDTDSLMVHFSHCIDDFQTHISDFRSSCLMASAIGLRLFAEDDGVIARMVEFIANGCNIKDEYYRKKFIFKNEFGFLAMALFAKKMYASSCFVQEGNPRDIHSIAVSGMSFKKRDAAEFLEPVMTKLYDVDILTVKQIRVESILDKYYDLRRLLDENLDKDTSFYQVQGLKEVAAYDPTKILPEQLRGALIWNVMNPDEEMQPMDRVIVIKLDWKRLEEHKDNPRVAELYKYNRILHAEQGGLANGSADRNGPTIDNDNMNSDPVICIPENYKEIPDYIRLCIDKEGTSDKLLSPFKQMLGLFDVYMADTKNGMVASRMISI
jgi:hypothetical protein